MIPISVRLRAIRLARRSVSVLLSVLLRSRVLGFRSTRRCRSGLLLPNRLYIRTRIVARVVHRPIHVTWLLWFCRAFDVRVGRSLILWLRLPIYVTQLLRFGGAFDVRVRRSLSRWLRLPIHIAGLLRFCDSFDPRIRLLLLSLRVWLGIRLTARRWRIHPLRLNWWAGNRAIKNSAVLVALIRR